MMAGSPSEGSRGTRPVPVTVNFTNTDERLVVTTVNVTATSKVFVPELTYIYIVT